MADDTTDLIRRARKYAAMANNPELYTVISELLGRLADEVEKLRAENARLKGSTFYRCEKCGATCIGED